MNHISQSATFALLFCITTIGSANKSEMKKDDDHHHVSHSTLDFTEPVHLLLNRFRQLKSFIDERRLMLMPSINPIQSVVLYCSIDMLTCVMVLLKLDLLCCFGNVDSRDRQL